jgi:hypothetical protein
VPITFGRTMGQRFEMEDISTMSRSRKRTPVFGNWAGKSDKPRKVASHRSERRAVRVSLAEQSEPPPSKIFGNPAHGQRDGKSWWAHATTKDMSK